MFDSEPQLEPQPKNRNLWFQVAGSLRRKLAEPGPAPVAIGRDGSLHGTVGRVRPNRRHFGNGSDRHMGHIQPGKRRYGAVRQRC